MAIRDDFTAGEVLAAADLNDTFASKVPFSYGTATPSTTVEGFIWFDEATTPPTAKFWDGAAFQLVSPPSGLVHIATESFSAVSSVSLNGVFTSTYQNYLVLVYGIGDTGGRDMTMKLRAGGVDSSANYQFTTISAPSSPMTSASSSGQSSINAGNFSSNGSFLTIQLFRPQLADETFYQLQCIRGDANFQTFAGHQNANTAQDGFSLIASTSTITGIVRVYGYQNS